MNLYASGLVWVLGVAAIAAVGTIVVHRFGTDEGRGSNEAVGQVFTIVGGLHAVLMAFVLISLFDTVSTVEDDAQTEADSLVAVYWASDSLPEPARSEIQELSRTYASTVIDQEWPRMHDGEQVGGSGWAQLDRLRGAIDTAPTQSDWQQVRKEEAASQLWNVYQARQDRLTAANSDGVNTVVWIALIVGSILAISLPYLFDGPQLMTHMFLMATFAGTVALLLFAIYQLQNPFSGGAQVGPDAFTAAVERFPTSRAG